MGDVNLSLVRDRNFRLAMTPGLPGRGEPAVVVVPDGLLIIDSCRCFGLTIRFMCCHESLGGSVRNSSLWYLYDSPFTFRAGCRISGSMTCKVGWLHLGSS